MYLFKKIVLRHEYDVIASCNIKISELALNEQLMNLLTLALVYLCCVSDEEQSSCGGSDHR